MASAALYDPDFITREGLKTILEESHQIDSYHILEPGQNTIQLLRTKRPNILLVHYSGTSPELLDLLKNINRELPGIKILAVLSDFDHLEVSRLLKLELSGFLTRECSQEEFHLALSRIIQGGKFYCQRVVDVMHESIDSGDEELSSREMQVIRMIATGLSSEEISQELMLSIHTVNSHRKRILKKLGLKSPTELIIYAVRKNWVKLS